MHLDRDVHLTILVGLLSCTQPADMGGQEGSDVESDSDTDVDADTDADADADSDADDDEANPYTTLDGWFSFDYGGSTEPGQLDCALSWWITGTPLPIPVACEDCEFVFDVSWAFDAGNSTDDGTCADLATDFELVLAHGYYDGQGPTVLYAYGGEYLPLTTSPYGYGEASFESGYWSWSNGAVDLPYDGYYFTYQWSLGASVY